MLTKDNRKVFSLALVLSALTFNVSESYAEQVKRESNPASTKAQLNRSVISVGSDVYTFYDVDLLLRLWNALSDKVEPLTTNFEAAKPVLKRKNIQVR